MVVVLVDDALRWGAGEGRARERHVARGRLCVGRAVVLRAGGRRGGRDLGVGAEVRLRQGGAAGALGAVAAVRAPRGAGARVGGAIGRVVAVVELLVRVVVQREASAAGAGADVEGVGAVEGALVVDVGLLLLVGGLGLLEDAEEVLALLLVLVGGLGVWGWEVKAEKEVESGVHTVLMILPELLMMVTVS